MPFQKIQMFLNESNYVTVHTVINTMTSNGAKKAQKLPQ